MLTIEIENLPDNTTECDIKKLFSKYGEIENIYIYKEIGFAHIKLEENEEFTVEELNKDLKDMKPKLVSDDPLFEQSVDTYTLQPTPPQERRNNPPGQDVKPPKKDPPKS